MTRPPTWNEPMSRKAMGSLPCAQAEPAARLTAKTMPKRRMLSPFSFRNRNSVAARSLDQAFPDHPCLDDIGDLGIVLVLHQHMRISLDADVGQVDHVDGAAAGA